MFDQIFEDVSKLVTKRKRQINWKFLLSFLKLYYDGNHFISYEATGLKGLLSDESCEKAINTHLGVLPEIELET